MKLHQRCLDLLLNVQDAVDHISDLNEAEIRNLLTEAEMVLRDLLARDVPRADDAPDQETWVGLGRGGSAD